VSVLRGGLCVEGPARLTRKDAIVVWQFCDGKAGHDNQSTGLVEALSTIRKVEAYALVADPMGRAAFYWAAHRYPRTMEYPDPDLIIGAGRRTHLSMLAARRARGGRIIVLMKPDLPLRWFDLCIIPRHDNPPARADVLVSYGALARPMPAREQNPQSGLILLGGPSKHFTWNGQHVIKQIVSIVAQDPARAWVIVTSRRTPPEFQQTLVFSQPELAKRLSFCEDTGSDWLPEQLAVSPVAWVTEDSVSMIYEALSAGAGVGLIELPRRGSSRIARGTDALLDEGRVIGYEDWRAGKPVTNPDPLLQESVRCAQEVASRWLSDL
jgi:mitochondrial fission protein ELM1